jgi:hypothetical protein
MIVIDGRALLLMAVLLGVMIYEKCKFDIWNDQRKERVREKTPRLCPTLKTSNTEVSINHGKAFRANGNISPVRQNYSWSIRVAIRSFCEAGNTFSFVRQVL